MANPPEPLRSMDDTAASRLRVPRPSAPPRGVSGAGDGGGDGGSGCNWRGGSRPCSSVGSRARVSTHCVAAHRSPRSWRHRLQKSALSSYARRPPLLWTSGRDPLLVARRRHASTASPSRAFAPAVSRPTRPTARVNCTHRGPVTMFQCRSQSRSAMPPHPTCLPVLAIPDCSCSRITLCEGPPTNLSKGVW